MATEGTIRATHREREETVAALRAAYTLGCLDNEELADRSGRAYAAKTRSELAGLVADLPPVPPSAEVQDSAAPSAGNWPEQLRQALSCGGWLFFAAAGAWLISVAAGGIVALPLLFLWLGLLRLTGRLRRRRC